MTEPKPEYTNGTFEGAVLKAADRLTLKEYYRRRRRRIIAEPRDLDRLLGNEQTIPERRR